MIKVKSETIQWDKIAGTTEYDIFINGVKKSSTKTSLQAQFALSDGDVVRVVAQPSGEWQEITFDYSVEIDTPSPPTTNVTINTWEYAQAIPQPRVKIPTIIDVTSASELDSALKTLKPGQSIRGHNFTYSGLDIRNRALSDYAEIDLSDNVTLQPASASGYPVFLGWNHKLHIFGGNITGNMLRIYSLVDCAIMDMTVDHSKLDGCLVFGINSPVQRCIFRIKTNECSYDWAYVQANDPHATKGTGIHAFNLGDTNYWIEDSMFILDVVNQHTGAGCELSNLRKGAIGNNGLVPGGSGVQIWMRANGLLFKSSGQTAANGLQFWGGSSMITDDCKVHYIEVNEAQGKVVEAGWADGPFSGVDVEYGRGHNVNLLHPSAAAFQPYKGITYHDCKVI